MMSIRCEGLLLQNWRAGQNGGQDAMSELGVERQKNSAFARAEMLNILKVNPVVKGKDGKRVRESLQPGHEGAQRTLRSAGREVFLTL
ncbi:MAG: hypothetical protein LZF62_50360 [Nitrospira sp.]|nr:MAG: hypothetical protein LZF62_50360 [Nitrospira sp.]